MTTSPPPPQAQRYSLPEANLGDLPPRSAFFEFVLLTVHTSLWWSPGDHPAWTIPLPGDSLSLHQVFSQFMQQVNIVCLTPSRVGDLIWMGNLILGTVQRVGGVCSMCMCSMLFNACVRVVLVLIVCVCLYVCVSVCLCVRVCYCSSGCYRSFQIQCKFIPSKPPIQVSADSAVVAQWYLPEAIVGDSHPVATIWNGKSVLYSCSYAQVALIIHTLCGVLDYPCLPLQHPYVGSGYSYAGWSPPA